MPITPRVCLLRVTDGLWLVARQRPRATGRVRGELTAGLHRDVRGLLYRLPRAIFGRLAADRPLATDPGNHGGPVCVVMAPAGLAFLAATTRLASQRPLPTLCRLALLTSSVIECIRFHGALQLTLHLIRQRRIPQPPAPAI